MTNAIILWKDFQRIRTRVKSKIRKGKRCAEQEEDRRVERVVDSLSEVDFCNWNRSQSEVTQKILIAILKEWGTTKTRMSEDEITWRFARVLVVGAMRVMLERGELETNGREHWMKH